MHHVIVRPAQDQENKALFLMSVPQLLQNARDFRSAFDEVRKLIYHNYKPFSFGHTKELLEKRLPTGKPDLAVNARGHIGNSLRGEKDLRGSPVRGPKQVLPLYMVLDPVTQKHCLTDAPSAVHNHEDWFLTGIALVQDP